MLHRLTVLDGIVDITNDIEMLQSNVTLIRKCEFLHKITHFFNHWLYRRGVLELDI